MPNRLKRHIAPSAPRVLMRVLLFCKILSPLSGLEGKNCASTFSARFKFTTDGRGLRRMGTLWIFSNSRRIGIDTQVVAINLFSTKSHAWTPLRGTMRSLERS
jgi:hypothetical protein